jgi:hypothetical protein
MALTWREPGWRQQTATQVEPAHEPMATLLLGGGWWLNRTVALDGSIGLVRRQSLSWNYSYMSNLHISTTDRDMPILGHARIRLTPNSRMSVEALVGGGLTRHVAESFVLANCPRFGSSPCTTLTPPQQRPEAATWEWTVSAGVDVPIHLSARVALTPTARLLYAHRREYLTPDLFRGPDCGSGVLPLLGATLRWTGR